MSRRDQRALLLRLRHQAGVLLRGLMVEVRFRLQIAPRRQRLDGDAVLNLGLLRPHRREAGTQREQRREALQFHHFAFHGAIFGSIIIAGIASAKHTIKNMTQPVSATI